MASSSYPIPQVRTAAFAAARQAVTIEESIAEFDVRRFVETHQDAVVNTCYHLVRDLDEAHDIAQQVFMSALSVADRIATDAEWRAWLYRAAVTRSLNVLRSRKRRKWITSLSGNRDDGIDPVNVAALDRLRPDRLLEIAELRRELDVAVDELPDRQRTAFVLHRYEGLTSTEIAVIMQLRTKAVESLLHRGVTRLRQRLLNHYRELRGET
jgi:RNA polymerase sigma-70 factor (ECF subfamily)